MSKDNPFKGTLDSLREGAEVVEFRPEKAAKPHRKAKGRKFAYVPLDGNWGYRVIVLAGSGAAIVVHALFVQRTTGKGDVPITAELLRCWGIHRSTRCRTLQRLERAGVATVRYRGQRRGCPLLTLHMPPE
jgi:hypothetical protein